MQRNIKLKNHEIVAKACLVEKEETKKGKNHEIDVSIITAVDLKGSKALQMASGDFGIVIYNELNFGFIISWNEFEKLQADLKISEEKYEEFLDNFINDFSDTVIEFLNNK
ncbi:hypothetical protein [Aliarcobacter skirrowii]|uniref:hypothetical protein n=1 Tax=Aliarcobacter skirrowii TaxID=28200 RepID=UPI0029AA43FF|nr:hypothetical protein [Aliarcobacter skirrowii]MDX4028685.1 hypothetical protein [Aliarcobacter skirrowii]